MFREKNDSLIISYVGLRRWIGILGISLPFVCMLGGHLFGGLPAQESISIYYYTNMRDFFVGLLIGVALFLVTYRGYERIDSILTTICGIAGLGIAVFPCLYASNSSEPVGIFQVVPDISNMIHLVCATIFFLLLACTSFFIFTLTKSKGAPITRMKRIRNLIYRACGVVIVLAMAVMTAILVVSGPDKVHQTIVVLICETVMLAAFGASWLVKGETLFRDGPNETAAV